MGVPEWGRGAPGKIGKRPQGQMESSVPLRRNAPSSLRFMGQSLYGNWPLHLGFRVSAECRAGPQASTEGTTSSAPLPSPPAQTLLRKQALHFQHGTQAQGGFLKKQVPPALRFGLGGVKASWKGCPSHESPFALPLDFGSLLSTAAGVSETGCVAVHVAERVPCTTGDGSPGRAAGERPGSAEQRRALVCISRMNTRLHTPAWTRKGTGRKHTERRTRVTPGGGRVGVGSLLEPCCDFQ